MTGKSVHEIDPHQLQEMLRRDAAILVDVREGHEHAAERIPGAILRPLSNFDPGALPRSPGKATVLHCGTGKRSATAAQACLDAGDAEAVHLAGGLQAWKGAGFATLTETDD